MTNKFVWDGEKIKQVRTEEEQKFTPKDILNALNHVRNQIHLMKGDQEKMAQQAKILENNLKNASEHEMQLKEFEEKCIELQVEKLKFLIEQNHEECKEKAEKSSKATIEKDPNSLTEAQKKQLPYLDYQRSLATHPKIAEKISSQIITKYLYDEPVFNNPFKD